MKPGEPDAQFPLGGGVAPWWGPRAQADAAAEAWVSGIDRKQHVGSRHHIVPRFILKRFANDQEQVRVRYPGRRDHKLCSISDLAVKDFYTFIDQQGELDASYEQLWGVIEGQASGVLRTHLDSAFFKPHPFTRSDKQVIDSLVAIQSVRGPAARRASELIADYGVKLLNQDKMSAEDMTRWEFIPHQNEHLQTVAALADKSEQELANRGARLVTLDRPLLVVSDEPVWLERPKSYAPPTRAQLRQFPPGVQVDGRDVPPEDVIMFQNPRGVGFAEAGRIALPIDPRIAIVYDKPGTARPMPHLELNGTEANLFAKDLVGACLEQAVLWVAGHPDHPRLANVRLPKPQPALIIIDGGSNLAHNARTTLRRAPRRLDRKARPSSADRPNE